MITTIPTKYDIGQKVYLKKTALDFSRGYKVLKEFITELLKEE